MRIAPLRSFLRAVFRRSRMEDEMDTEIRFHLDARIDDLVARGVTPGDARRRAQQEFGDARRWKEQGREARGLGLVDGLRADVTYGLRWLARSPGLAAMAIVSMALGIGANTAIFSAVNTILIERLPVDDPEALVLLGISSRGEALGTTFPFPFYRLLRDSDTALAGVLASAAMSPALDAGGAPERVSGELVSGDYFDVLGVAPHLGRHLTRGDERAGANQVVVLSHSGWMRRFGGDPGVIGRVVRLNDVPMTVVGVSPPSFHGIEVGGGPELRVPISLQAAMHGSRSRLEAPGFWWLQIVGRLEPGVSRERAADALNRQFRAYRASLPSPGGAPERLDVLDGSRGDPTLADQFTVPLAVLSGLVAVVLVLVCVNVGSLLFARATSRRGEISLRLAMGAGRLRIVRQLLVEACLLAGVAGFVGLVASRLGVRLLADLAGAPPEFVFALDARVLGFAGVATAATGLVCGLAPAWAATRVDVLRALRTETGQYTRVATTPRRLFVAGQVALALALLIGAGLFARTLFNLRHADVGFESARLGMVTLNPRLAGYDADRLPGYYATVLDRITALPTVESAAFGVIPLLSGSRWGSGLTLDTGERDEQPGPLRNAVGPGFFRTARIPLLAGREFAATDVATAPPVAIVNEAFARRYFGESPAIGRRIGPGGPSGEARFTIVGVTRDSRATRVRDARMSLWYTPYAQAGELGELTLHVRATASWDDTLRDVRQTVASIDARVAIPGGATVRERIEDQVEIERLLAVLAGTFAATALLLAALGLYSTVSYLTAARTREIGIRMALGASPAAIVRLVFAAHAPALLGGTLGGVAISLLATARLRPLLFELEPTDPATVVTAASVVAVVTAADAFLPARRAARIDPATTVK